MKITDIAHTVEEIINQFVSTIFIFENCYGFALRTDNKCAKRYINSKFESAALFEKYKSRIYSERMKRKLKKNRTKSRL